MPVYRYKRTGLDISKLQKQVPPADAASLVSGSIASSVYWDVTAPTTSLDDISDYMSTQGWSLDSTDPSTTPQQQSQSDNEIRRLYDAVVSSSGGDYTSVYDAFNSGANSVFVRSGFYVETNTIVLPTSGCILHGEGGSVLSLTGSTRLELDGSGGVQETTGTISVTTDDATVTGVGTSFTNLSAADYIRIKGTWLRIDSITNDTALELSSPWRGESFSSISYVAQDMAAGLSLKLISIKSGSIGPFYVRGCAGFNLRDVVLQPGTGIGMEIVDSYGGHLEQIFAKGMTLQGLVLTSCNEVTIEGACHFDNNDNDGILINGDSSHIQISNSSATNNDGDGVSVEGTAEEVTLTNAILAYNDGKGLNTEPTSGTTIANACIMEENGDWGVDFDGSNNVINGCVINGNGSGGVQGGDSGTIVACQVSGNSGPGLNILGSDDDNVISNNRVVDNTGHGVALSSDRNVFSGNLIVGNGSDGVNIASGGDNNKFAGNTIDGNSGTDIVDNGAGNVFVDTDDRTASGIRTATSIVSVSGATAPSSGQVLKATSGTAATWQDESGGTVYPDRLYEADQLESPNSSDWAVNALAPLTPSPSGNGISVRRFDDTTAEGIGVTVEAPTGATNIILDIRSQAVTAPGSAKTVALSLYEREIDDNGAITSWSSANDLSPDLSIPTNAYFQLDSWTISLSSLGMAAGQQHQLELVRDTADAGDTLSGDWGLKSIRVRWS